MSDSSRVHEAQMKRIDRLILLADFFRELRRQRDSGEELCYHRAMRRAGITNRQKVQRLLREFRLNIYSRISDPVNLTHVADTASGAGRLFDEASPQS